MSKILRDVICSHGFLNLVAHQNHLEELSLLNWNKTKHKWEGKKENEKGGRKEKISQLQDPSSPVQRELLLQVFISFQKFPMHIQVGVRTCYLQCSALKFFHLTIYLGEISIWEHRSHLKSALLIQLLFSLELIISSYFHLLSFLCIYFFQLYSRSYSVRVTKRKKKKPQWLK